MCTLCREPATRQASAHTLLPRQGPVRPEHRPLLRLWLALSAWEGPAGWQDNPCVSNQAGASALTKTPQLAVVPAGSRALPPGKRGCNCAGSCQRLVSGTSRPVATRIARAAAELAAVRDVLMTTDCRRLNKMMIQQHLGGPAGPGKSPWGTSPEGLVQLLVLQSWKGSKRHLPRATTGGMPLLDEGCHCRRTEVEPPLRRR